MPQNGPAGPAPGGLLAGTPESGSALAVKTSTLEGWLFSPDPYLSATELDLQTQEAPAPPRRVVLPESSGVRARAGPPSRSGAAGPADSAAAASTLLSHDRSRARPAAQRRGVAHRIGSRLPNQPRVLRPKARPSSLGLAAAAAGNLPQLSRTGPSGFGSTATTAGLGRWASAPFAGLSEGRRKVGSSHLLQVLFLPGILTRRHDP